MRLNSFELLVAAAIVLYIPSSSEKSSPAIVQVDGPANEHFHASDRSAVSDDGILQANNATNREERAQFSSEDFASIVKVANYLATKVRDLVHSTGPIGREYAEILAGMKDLQTVLAAGDVKALQGHPEWRGKRTHELIQGPNIPRPVLKRSRVTENEQAMQSPTGDAQMADIIKKVRENSNYFPDIDSLHVLEKDVQAWNAAHPHTQPYTLLHALVKVYGTVAKLASALSKAKLNENSSADATRLQAELLKIWYDNKYTVRDVFSFLGIFDPVTRSLEYENLDTFERYVELYNKNYPGKEACLFVQLAQFLGDTNFMKLIVVVGHNSKCGKMMMKNRFTDWRWKKSKFTTIIKKLTKLGFDDSTIFDVLSKFYGEAEVRHAMPKTTESSTNVGHSQSDLKRRQTWLVTDLLNSRVSIDGVYNLLKLSESTDVTMTKQRMKIFHEYVQLRNNRHLEKIDAEQYRTQRLVEATRVDQERALKRQRIDGPDAPR